MMAKAEHIATEKAAKPAHCFFLSALGSGNSLSILIGFSLLIIVLDCWEFCLIVVVTRVRHVECLANLVDVFNEFRPIALNILGCDESVKRN